MNLRRLIPPPFWRPQCNGSTDCLARAPRLVQCLCWVKTGKARSEQMFSALPPKADIRMLVAPNRPSAAPHDQPVAGTGPT
jgi:hypothetical protein